MRGRNLLLLSLGLNLALAALAVSLWRQSRAAVAVLGGTHTTHVITTGRILPLVRKQIFNWSQLESEDYDRYLTNLRLIGCPDSTIRDLIVCDVDALYAHRRITDLPDEYAEWWRPEGNTNYYQLYFQRHDQLDKERRDLLTKLLGPDWQLTERYVQRSLPEPLPALTGSILGNLGDDVKNSIYDLVEKFRDRQWNTDNYTNRLLDSKALREQLARILTPPQLEEYLLRYSDTADELRGQLGNLKYFNATPDEFRALFRATDNLDLKIKLAQYSDDPAEQQRASQLEQQRTDALKLVLGSARYADYERLQDSDYRDALDLVTEHGGNPQTAAALYAINQATAAEQEQLGSNTNLNPLTAQLEQKKIELAQLQAQAQALGQAAPEPPPAPPAPATVTTQRHILASGENLGDLMRRYLVNPSDLQAVNPGVNLQTLKPGDNINIPSLTANAVPQ